MSKKFRTLAAIYALAAITALGAYSLLTYDNLAAYRLTAKYSSQRAVEESVAAVRSLGSALKKSVYAVDGSMCGKVCAESYADALSAQTAISTLPFSTQELERISSFLGVTGDYAYTLCGEAAETGFTDEQVKTLTRLSETAGKLADSLTELQSDLNSKTLIVDSTEKRLANVGVEDTEKLSTRMLKYEADFAELKTPEYDGRYAEREQRAVGTLTETQKLAAAADFAGVGLGGLKSEYAYEGGDGRRCYSAGELEICVSSRGVESMSCARLVSEEKISVEQAQEIAARFLNAHGYDSVRLMSSAKNGATTSMNFARVEGEALCVDELVRISVALDDGSVYSFNAEGYSGEELHVQWSIPPEQAAAKLPQGLELRETAKVIIKTDGGKALPCYLLDCADGELTVRVYVDAGTGKQCRIEL